LLKYVDKVSDKLPKSGALRWPEGLSETSKQKGPTEMKLAISILVTSLNQEQRIECDGFYDDAHGTAELETADRL
jgi:hypothetical protein